MACDRSREKALGSEVEGDTVSGGRGPCNSLFMDPMLVPGRNTGLQPFSHPAQSSKRQDAAEAKLNLWLRLMDIILEIPRV